jgi:hypothetical protein
MITGLLRVPFVAKQGQTALDSGCGDLASALPLTAVNDFRDSHRHFGNLLFAYVPVLQMVTKLLD